MTDGPEPYRSTLERPPPEAAREFVYAARHREDQRGGSGGVLPGLVLGGAACAVAFRLEQPTVGVAVVVAVAVWAAWVSWRQSRRQAGVVLRVDDARRLLVYPWRGARPASLALEDVHDVVLDTRVVRKAKAAAPRARRAGRGGGGSPPADMSRIALVLAPGVAPVVLTEAYASHSETVEQISKLKMFLRRLGWLPEDERGQAPAPAGSEEGRPVG